MLNFSAEFPINGSRMRLQAFDHQSEVNFLHIEFWVCFILLLLLCS